MYNSSYWLNFKELWSEFPKPLLEPRVKWYYIVQFAFWLQQLFVVNIEERRKDHWQMFTHHVFTSALLLTSYGFYQTKVGNVILSLMDVVDILLPVSATTIANQRVTDIFSSPKC
jgi:acyl-CoA-dependent ceramide synthase